MPKRRITADGDVVMDDDSNTASPSATDMSSLFGSNLSGSSSSSDRLDVFGFSLEKKQCAMLLIFCILILGPRATFGLIIAWGVYRVWSESTGLNSSNFTSSNNSSSNSGGGSTTTTTKNSQNHWSSRVGRGGNIRGMSDLPCDPRRG